MAFYFALDRSYQSGHYKHTNARARGLYCLEISLGECHTLRADDPARLNSSGCLNVEKGRVPCQHGYRYDDAVPDPFWSLVSENDWVCDRAHYGPTILQVQAVGIVLTTSLCLQPSDTWGRMPIIYITNALFILSREGMGFVNGPLFNISCYKVI